MARVSTSIEIAVPPRAVWDVIMDPRRYGDWVTIHRKVGKLDDGPLREGFEVEQTLALAGAPFKVRWRLAVHDPPHHAIWEGRGPARSTARIEDTLTAAGAGTRFDYLNDFKAPGGPLGAMAGRVLVSGISEREANRSLRRLKQLLEEGS